MSRRTITVFVALILACEIVLVGGVSLARGVARAFAARAGGGVAELKVTIREWDVPTKGAHPHDPALAPDGSLWFTEQMQNKLGRLDPASGTFKEYVLKIEDSGPHGLVADSNGNIWFTGNGKGYIGKLDPKSGDVTAYKMPDEKAEDPHTAVFDAHGIMWFTVQVGNMVGRLDPHTGKVDLKAVQGQRALPYGIAINSKGVPFFCEFGTNKMGMIDPRTMAITEFKLLEGMRPRRIAIDARDRIYFTDYEGGYLGRLVPWTGAVMSGRRQEEQDLRRTELRSRRMGRCGTANLA
jgi:virginiamycin B lyase